MQETDKQTELQHALQLLRQQRWAALATLGKRGEVEASMVAYVIDPDSGDLVLHLSQLAAHSRNIEQNPQVSLAISEQDDGRTDPQELARVSLSGIMAKVDKTASEYERLGRLYREALPASEQLFAFADFNLFTLNVTGARYVGGFARAFSYGADDLKEGLTSR